MPDLTHLAELTVPCILICIHVESFSTLECEWSLLARVKRTVARPELELYGSDFVVVICQTWLFEIP